MALSFFLKKHTLIIGGVLIVLAGGGFFIATQKAPQADPVVVEKRDITQEVNVTGKVQPTESVDLAFEKGGRVVGLYADIGDIVVRGQTLAVLGSSDLQAKLLEAEASVKAEEAKLLELQKGTRPEELQVQQTKVSNAQTAVASAYDVLINATQDALTKSDDAIRNRVDQFFTSPRSANPRLNFLISNSQSENELISARVALESILVSWKTSLGEPFSNETALLTDTNLKLVRSFLDNAALAVNALVATNDLSQATIDTWKSAVSTARTNVNTAITNFLTAQESYSSAELALTLAENELSLDQAGATKEQLLAQEASLEEAESRVKNIRAQIAQTTLSSPLNGIVTKNSIKVGEIVTVGMPLMSVISDGSYEIKMNIPEADIAKVELAMRGRVTLDAYGDDVVFKTTVVEIDPSETVIDGVSTYTTTLAFLEKDSRIRSGMTANIDIVTGERSQVPAIPFRNIRTEGADRVVYVLNDKGEKERRVVTTGLRGSDGYIEILSGVSVGEKISTTE